MAATYTVKQVSKILGYSTNSIYTFLKEKRIKGVRVGKGRFRIPQSELDRLLLISKSQKNVENPYSEEAVEGSVVVEKSEAKQQQIDIVLPEYTLENVPGLFDWFIGLASILLGSSMFVFTRFFEEFAMSPFTTWVLPLRISLIAGGIGILVTDISGKVGRVWYTIFRLIVAAAYIGFSLLLFKAGDIDGMIIFSLMGIAILYSSFAKQVGIGIYITYALSVLFFLILTMLVSPTSIKFIAIIQTFLPRFSVLPPLALGFFIVVLFALLWGFFKQRFLFWVIVTVIGWIFLSIALAYAMEIYWGRALFMLLIGLMCLFIPGWESLQWRFQADRKIAFWSFGLMLFVFFIAMGVVRLLQTNVLAYARDQQINKVSYGKVIVESVLDTAQQSLEGAANNPLLVTAYKDKELADDKKKKKTSKVIETISDTELTATMRGLFESNRGFSRIIALTSAQEILTSYPLDDAKISVPDRLSDLIKEVQGSKKVVISDVLLSDTGAIQIVVAVPVIDRAADVLLGVLVGSIDVQALGDRLQQLADPRLTEYFTVVDSTGKRVVYPERLLLGSQIDPFHPLRKAILGAHGAEDGYGYQGARYIMAYDTIRKNHWGIAIQSPLFTVLAATGSSTFLILAVTIFSVLIIAGSWMVRKRIHLLGSGEGNSP